MTAIDIVVFSRLPDLPAITANHTIKHLMGYGDKLLEVRRADHYRLELAVEETKNALALAERMVNKTLVFINPNKQIAKVVTPDKLNTLLPAPKSGFRVLALVNEREDNLAGNILSNLRDTLGFGEVSNLTRGVLWFLLWSAPKEEARRLTEEVMITRSRKVGLLSNPHSQRAEIV
jgi:hypothetical protein